MLTNATLSRTAKLWAGHGLSYCEPERKKQAHRCMRNTLKALAESMGLKPEQYSVSSNMGGIAVSGEVTLHADNIHLWVQQGCMGGGFEVCYRTCKSRKDYTGGRNNFTGLKSLSSNDDLLTLAQKLKMLAEWDKD